jgi:hypothetical protein
MEPQTSRAYIASHILLRHEVYSNWKNFYENVNKGPENMKVFLADLWNNINEKNVKKGMEIIDKDRSVTKDDFDISANKLQNMQTFYFIFPDSDFEMAQAKCVALVFAPQMPRYFTMELSKINENNEREYIIGEWTIENNSYTHVNYGSLEKNTIEFFAGKIDTILEKTKPFVCGLKKETLDLINLENATAQEIYAISLGKVYLHQVRFKDYLGGYQKWNTDVNIGKLDLDDKQFDVEYIGTTAPEMDNNWCSSEIEKVIPDEYVNLMIKTRKVLEKLNIKDYMGTKIPMNENISDSEIMTVITAFCPQNVVYFSGVAEDNSKIVMLVKNLPEEIFKSADSNELNARFLELLEYEVISQRLMLKALLSENGISFIENENEIIAKFSEESVFTYKFNENNFDSMN